LSAPGPAFLAEAPRRDERFEVRDRWEECTNLPPNHPDKTLEFLHRQMNEEVDALECSARSLSDFAQAPWEMRMFLARQCSDEARHAWLFRDLFLRRGGTLGQYPVMNFQYRIICGLDLLVTRLAVQNRTFEAEGIDAIEAAVREARANGDEDLAALFEGQFADEIQHVRIANEYIHDCVRREPRLLLRIAAAITRATEVFEQVFSDKGTAVEKYLPSGTGRHEAGFTDAEIEMAMRIAEDRRERVRAARAAS
jgi:uncharacterized ferritin-like protein (DUF455 family)